MRSTLVTVAVSAAVMLAAPWSSNGQSTSIKTSGTASPPTRRFAADSFWVRQWERGGANEDDLLIEPRATKVSGDLVVVLDLGTREVIGFDANTGQTRFVKAARGTGPGEFKRPHELLRSASGFGVLDAETARISVFSTNGALLWDATVPGAAFAEALCAPNASRVLVKRSGKVDALLLVDSTGKQLATYTLPVNVSEGASFAASAKLAGPTSSGCIVVPLFGRSWFALGAKGFIAYPLIDPGPEPTIKAKDKVLARDGRDKTISRVEMVSESPVSHVAMVRGDTLIIKATPTKPPLVDVFDYYLLPSGRYVHSRRAFGGGSSMDVGSNGVFYATIITRNDSRLVAMKPSRTPTPTAPSAAPKSPTAASAKKR
ncbi:MAG: hypothetical protein IT353_16405 [Gemmatimonadaceae bacterium]|nr:hypothetical protein [Gemmatimonadaceae bacterium]